MSPRLKISYYNIHELAEDNFTVFSRVAPFSDWIYVPCDSSKIKAQFSSSTIILCHNRGCGLTGCNELEYFSPEVKTETWAELAKARNYTQVHNNAVIAAREA